MPDETPAEDPEGAPPAGAEATQEEAEPADLGDAGKQAIARMKAERNAAKDEAKKLQAQLDELQRAQMSDQERAIEEAKAAARAEVLGTVAGQLVDAEFKVAATGRLEEDALSNLLENLNRSSFMDENGNVLTDKVRALIDGIAPPATARPTDLGQGARSTPALGSDPLLEALKHTVGAR